MADHLEVHVNPVGNLCNLRCKYCYASGGDSPLSGNMSVNTFVRMVDLASEYIDSHDLDEVHFIFHGGEPFLWPYENYVRALEYAHSVLGTRAIFRAQTNGTMLTDEIAALFAKYGGWIGISLDGPKDIHDSLRVGVGNRGTFESVMSAISILKKYQERAHIVMVLTKLHLGREDEIYQFFKNLDLSVQINPMVSAGRAGSVSDVYGITPEEYARFMIGLFDLWAEDQNPPYIRNFEKIVAAFALGRRIPYHFFSVGCAKTHHFVALNYDGSLSICNRTASYGPAFAAANVYDVDRLEDLFSRPLWRLFEMRHDIVRERFCKSCWAYSVGACEGSGGCTHAAYVEGRFLEPPSICRGYVMLLQHIHDVIRPYLDEIAATRKEHV